jgi:hypothetical protein
MGFALFPDPEVATCTGVFSHRRPGVLGPFELVWSSPRISVLERAGGSEKVAFLEVAPS